MSTACSYCTQLCNLITQNYAHALPFSILSYLTSYSNSYFKSEFKTSKDIKYLKFVF